MKEALFFSLKVWFTTVILAHLVCGVLLWLLMQSTYNRKIDPEFLLQIVYGLPFALVYHAYYFLILLVLTYLVQRRFIPISKKKIVISVIAVPLAIPFYRILGILVAALGQVTAPVIICLAVPFMAFSFASIWFYKLCDVPNEATTL